MKYFLFFFTIFSLAYAFAVQKPVVASDQLTLRVLDIGQGDSLYVRLATKEDIVIDAGPNEKVLSQLGAYMPLGDREIELFVLTHNHADHIGGLRALIENYKVDRIWLSGAVHMTDQYTETMQMIKDKKIPVTIIKAGDSTTIGETSLTAFYPPHDMTGLEPKDQHDATIMTKLTYKEVCALLTGDLNFDHEKEILEIASNLHQSLECPILKVTHHGSATGSSEEFLAVAKPKIALISVGSGNRYGHPADSTLKRLTDFGLTIYRTDLQGTITVTTNGHQYWTKTEK